MKYTMSCQDCGWKEGADSIAEVVFAMTEHETETRMSPLGERHATDYHGPRGSWGTLSWAKHAHRQQQRLAAGRARAKARRESRANGPRSLSDMFNPAGPSKSKKRDAQREKVYAAERSMDGAGLDGGRFETVADMQAFVDKVMRSRYVKGKYPKASDCRVEVVRKSGTRGRVHQVWRRYYYELWMPDVHHVWTRLYTLHELAHVLEDFTSEGKSEAAHGRTFVRVFLGLVKRFLGADYEAALKAEYRARKVKWAKVGVRAPMTPEEKAIVAKRLADARKAKA